MEPHEPKRNRMLHRINKDNENDVTPTMPADGELRLHKADEKTDNEPIREGSSEQESSTTHIDKDTSIKARSMKTART